MLVVQLEQNTDKSGAALEKLPFSINLFARFKLCFVLECFFSTKHPKEIKLIKINITYLNDTVISKLETYSLTTSKEVFLIRKTGKLYIVLKIN